MAKLFGNFGNRKRRLGNKWLQRFSVASFANKKAKRKRFREDALKNKNSDLINVRLSDLAHLLCPFKDNLDQKVISSSKDILFKTGRCAGVGAAGGAVASVAVAGWDLGGSAVFGTVAGVAYGLYDGVTHSKGRVDNIRNKRDNPDLVARHFVEFASDESLDKEVVQYIAKEIAGNNNYLLDKVKENLGKENGSDADRSTKWNLSDYRTACKNVYKDIKSKMKQKDGSVDGSTDKSLDKVKKLETDIDYLKEELGKKGIINPDSSDKTVDNYENAGKWGSGIGATLGGGLVGLAMHAMQFSPALSILGGVAGALTGSAVGNLIGRQQQPEEIQKKQQSKTPWATLNLGAGAGALGGTFAVAKNIGKSFFGSPFMKNGGLNPMSIALSVGTAALTGLGIAFAGNYMWNNSKNENT